MRAREFILENKVRPDIDIEWDGNFMVYAFIDGKRVGHAEFASDDPEGESGFYAISVGVNPEYRRMGVATAMYDAAEERFGEIIPSESQTDDAKAFWQSRNLNEWLMRRRVGQVMLMVSPHVQDQAQDRGVPWHYIERIVDSIDQIPVEKLEQMQNFNNFYIRDDLTWAEIGCKLRVDPEQQLYYLYINTVVRREPGIPRNKAIPTIVIPD